MKVGVNMGARKSLRDTTKHLSVVERQVKELEEERAAKASSRLVSR